MKALVITFAEVWSSQVPLEWEQSQSVSSGKTSSGYSTVILSFPHSFIASHSSLPHPLLLHPSTPSSFTLPPPPPSPLHPFLQPSTPFLQPSTPSTPSFHSTSSSLIHSSVTPHPLPLHPPPFPILILHPSTPHSPPPPCLQIRRHCVSQVDTAGQNLADYEYKDVEYMAKVHGRRWIVVWTRHQAILHFIVEGDGGDNLDPSFPPCPNSILQVYYQLWFSQTPVEAVHGLLPLSLLFLCEMC